MSKPILQARYIPVGKRGWSLTKKHATAISQQILQSKAFGAAHSRLSGSNIDAQDLLLGMGVVLAGFLVIDPFGVNKVGLRLVLWIAPGITTVKCLYDSYKVALEKEKTVSLSTLGDMRTVKWVDYWISSTGASCIGLVLGYLDSTPDDSLMYTLTSNSTAMLLFQSSLLLWWIIGNQPSTADPDGSAVMTKEQSLTAGRAKSTDVRVLVNGVSRAVTIDSKNGVKDAKSVLPVTTSTNAEASRLDSAPSTMASAEPVTHIQKITTSQRKKRDETNTDTPESQYVKPPIKLEQRRALSSGSKETLSDDESAYSQPSGYETDLSKSLASSSVDGIPGGASPSISSPCTMPSAEVVKELSARGVGKSEVGTTLGRRSPSTSSSRSASSTEQVKRPPVLRINKAKTAIPAGSRSLLISSSRTASSSDEGEQPSIADIRLSKMKPAHSVAKGSSISSHDNALTEVIPRPRPIVSVEQRKQDPKPPPRTSRILAQLDDILLAELEEMGRSPADVTSNPSSLGLESPISLATPRIRRLGQTEQKIRQENLAVEGLHQKKSAKNERKGKASSKAKDMKDHEGLDLQLDALIDTRMSDLFSVSVASVEELKARGKPLPAHRK
ncbi:hypothetical protein QFC20_003860 [Naganishia adeliensis]|uniref:Uncharacterized protein n=1 Tax=Naganishia adeliensis TaxID=92952 RepID=A0ACC2W5D0_9TREE|nr:hypothetical protein QFC20_003860 [Naganishia adeliensis]